MLATMAIMAVTMEAIMGAIAMRPIETLLPDGNSTVITVRCQVIQLKNVTRYMVIQRGIGYTKEKKVAASVTQEQGVSWIEDIQRT